MEKEKKQCDAVCDDEKHKKAEYMCPQCESYFCKECCEATMGECHFCPPPNLIKIKK